MDPEQEQRVPPWPGLVHLSGGVVRMPACALWSEHESYAEPCWLEARAAPHDGRNAAAPTAAQLIAALAAQLVERAAAAEQTSSVLTLGGLDPARAADCVALELGPHGLTAARAEEPAPLVRRAVALAEPRRPWRQVARPCVPRSGRGESWPPLCERLGPSSQHEPVLLDRGDVVACVHEVDGWTLISATADDHPFSWLPSELLEDWVDPWVGGWSDELGAERTELAARADEREPHAAPTGALAAPAQPASEAPLVDGILALAHAALARLCARAAGAGEAPAPPPLPGPTVDEVPARVAQLLETWAAFAAPLDPRLASLSAIDVVLLALAAAPALDREVARRYRGLAAPEPPLTVGLIVDLAGASSDSRARAMRRLVRDQPLRSSEVLLVNGGHVASVASEVSVGNGVLAVCYGLLG
jgi:hypothetical protein